MTCRFRLMTTRYVPGLIRWLVCDCYKKRFKNGGGRAHQFGPFCTYEKAEACACEIDSMRDSNKPIFEDDERGFLRCDNSSSGELVDPSERNH